MEKVEAHLMIEVNVECPHCDEYLNLFDADKFEHLNEDGYLQRKVVDVFGADGFDEKIECPECEKMFGITEVRW